MARINIEDTWFDDPRRLKLMEKLGAVQVDGAALQIWRVAQGYYKRQQLVPKHVFMVCPNAQDFLDIGLAREIDGGIYIGGTNENFAWLRLKRESGSSGGKASASKRKQNVANRSKSNQTQPSSSYSSSSKDLVPTEQEAAVPSAPAPPAALDSGIQSVVAEYVKAFKRRYGPNARPHTGGKAIGALQRLVKDLGVERTSLLVQAYLQMDGAKGWFKTKHHDVVTLAENLNAVSVALANGSPTSDPKEMLRVSYGGFGIVRMTREEYDRRHHEYKIGRDKDPPPEIIRNDSEPNEFLQGETSQ